MQQPDLFAGAPVTERSPPALQRKETRRRRDEGIERAATNAERHIEEWRKRALQYVHDYAETHQQFAVEDVRVFAETVGFPVPPSRRAWGAVILAARREGWVTHVGFAAVKNPRAHACPRGVWESCIYRS